MRISKVTLFLYPIQPGRSNLRVFDVLREAIDRVGAFLETKHSWTLGGGRDV